MNDLSPMTAAGLYDRAIHVYKKSFGKQLAFAAIYGVISYVALFVISFLLVFVLTFIALIVSDVIITDTLVGTWLISTVVFVPLLLLWFSISSAGHAILSDQALYGNKVKLNVRQLMRISFRVFPTLLAQFIVSLPFVGLFFFLAWVDFTNYWLVFAVLATMYISYLLFLNIFSLAVVVSVFEQKTFINALIRSWELIKGEFWQVAAMRALWVVIILAIWSTAYGALTLFSVLVIFLLSIVNLGALGVIIIVVLMIAAAISMFIVMFAIMPMDGVFHATMYFNQRIKREGLDIEIRLERLKNDIVMTETVRDESIVTTDEVKDGGSDIT